MICQFKKCNPRISNPGFGAIFDGAKVFVCQIKRLNGHVRYFDVPIGRRVDPMFVHALKNTLDFSDNTLHNLFNLFFDEKNLVQHFKYLCFKYLASSAGLFFVKNSSENRNFLRLKIAEFFFDKAHKL